MSTFVTTLATYLAAEDLGPSLDIALEEAIRGPTAHLGWSSAAL